VPTADYVIDRLDGYGLSHLLLMGAMADLRKTPAADLAGDGMFRRYRERFHGPIIANVDIDHARGNRLVAEGLVDAVAFGRPFIANPDLPERFAAGAELTEPDPRTFYGHGSEGYTDYPALGATTTTTRSNAAWPQENRCTTQARSASVSPRRISCGEPEFC
jgi:N-ethylmaleimide reductase